MCLACTARGATSEMSSQPAQNGEKESCFTFAATVSLRVPRAPRGARSVRNATSGRVYTLRRAAYCTFRWKTVHRMGILLNVAYEATQAYKIVLVDPNGVSGFIWRRYTVRLTHNNRCLSLYISQELYELSQRVSAAVLSLLTCA